MLIKHGTSINITNDNGDIPVHYAAWGNSSETIAMLIKHGASISEAAVRMVEQL